MDFEITQELLDRSRRVEVNYYYLLFTIESLLILGNVEKVCGSEEGVRDQKE